MNDSNYNDAVSALFSPLHQARTREALQRSALRRKWTVQDMRQYMERTKLSLPVEIPIVHITGTKGKGSTACFCESILRERYHLNTGLFTSPHLVDVRERIRINGKPVSKKVFAQAYFDLRHRLQEYPDSQDGLPQLPGYFRMLTLMAVYIFANYEPKVDVVILEVGMGGRYDATNVFDTDRRNVVCGVTLLDLDHMRVLGNSLEQIAWEKGGIFQVHKGSTERVTTRPENHESLSASMEARAETVYLENATTKKRLFAIGTNTQPVLSVLRNCAAIEGCGQELYVVHEGQTIPSDSKLGLEGKHQRINAELAACLCESLVGRMKVAPHDEGTQGLLRALAKASWPGRCQSVSFGVAVENSSIPKTRINLRCDGAHTTKSMEACLLWFQSVCEHDADNVMERMLIFNCSHERNPVPLLQLLQRSFRPNHTSSMSTFNPLFDTVYFCRADTERPSMVTKSTARELLLEAGVENIPIREEGKDLPASTWQDTLATAWTYLERGQKNGGLADGPHVNVISNLTVAQAMDRIKDSAMKSAMKECQKRDDKILRVEVCVTGSLYTVGSALDAVGWTEDEAHGSLGLQVPS